MTNFRIEEILPKDTYALRHEVLWPNMAKEFVMLDNDIDGIHYGVIKNQEVISVISVYIDESVAQFRKFATKPSEQGKGYGTHLLRHIISEIRKKNINRLWCNARIHKAAYYENFGMVRTPNKFVKQEVSFIVMEILFECNKS